MNDSTNTLWDIFTETGNIEAYLKYKQTDSKQKCEEDSQCQTIQSKSTQ